MPATEQTWRDQKKLHVLFAISGTVLFIATVWMFLKDHSRSWKSTQATAKQILVKADEDKEKYVETAKKRREHAELQSDLLTAQAKPVGDELFRKFMDEVAAHDDKNEVAGATALPPLNDRLITAGDAAAAARAKANEKLAQITKLSESLATAQIDEAKAKQKLAAAPKDPAAISEAAAATAKVESIQKALQTTDDDRQTADTDAVALEKAASELRKKLLGQMNALIKAAKFKEDNLLTERKFENANLDKAKADEGLIIRDYSAQEKVLERKLAAATKNIGEIDLRVTELTLRYQAAAAHRKSLQGTVKEITAEADEILKKIEENRGDLVRLERAIADRRSTYVVWWGYLPLPGKKMLELPITDAFNSPLKIENLWSEGLDIDYNFRDVKRYDRCTTCHQMMEKSQPGAADQPGFVKDRELTLILTPPTPQVLANLQAEAKKNNTLLTVEDVFGVAIGNGTLIGRDGVSIQNVVDGELATQARLALTDAATAPVPGDVLRAALLKTSTAGQQLVDLGDDPHNPFPATPGLQFGDVILDVDGSVVRNAEEARRLLLDGATGQRPVQIRLRRGLKNPFTSHPRLDLFVGSMSPHKMQEFGCTICHEGQGSATDFKWASHSPNSVEQAERWNREHGWFDNHHWIYPMNAKRFAESSCIKCHHEVVDLESSERFPEAPAPKVTRGYNLIRKYGCYGCHEMNGYDGPNKRVGPDLRLEPNYFAAALQLKADPNYAKLEPQVRGWVDAVVAHPERAVERNRLYEFLLNDKGDGKTESQLTALAHDLAPLFKDIDAPGALRKPGPSLRYSGQKLDEAFMLDWINNPRNFRPGTRMPQVFNLDSHLQGDADALHLSHKFEPLEVEGITAYLRARTQKFDLMEVPAGGDAARGKQQLQTRGCIACHSHGDFPEAEGFRDPDEIVQGPDLSRVAEKFDAERNPQGKAWLYSWIKDPTRYHPRTVMPNLFLDTIDVKDANGETIKADIAADIVEYLLSSKPTKQAWQPVRPQPEAKDPDQALSEFFFEHLKDAFANRVAAQYSGGELDEDGKFKAGSGSIGIPSSRLDELKGAERELVLGQGQRTLDEAQKLAYIGRKSIAKYGCYGCHDIPGFEDAKPIGAGLNDWGRKEPAKLAFEHIAEYLEHGHGQAHAKESQEPADDSAAHASHGHAAGQHPEHAEYPEFMLEQLFHGNRIGFLYQKLREPRSYDYEKASPTIKKYNDRLRMPQFPFNDDDREAVMTFVLGLIADPPAPKYVYAPKPREKAIIEGKQVLEKFNCQACHILEMEQWSLSFPQEFFGQQLDEEERAKIFPFLLPHVTTDEAKASIKGDRRGLNHATLSLMPRINPDGLPYVTVPDPDGEPESPAPENKYDPTKATLYFDLWRPAVLGGKSFVAGLKPVNVPATMIEHRHPAHGGFLARYLLPVVTKMEAAATMQDQKGQEAMAWLPPPLTNEGRKVQSDWLHDFLLEPYPIRPATYMRMPKFNMTPDEATKLAAYFAAVDRAEYPYTFTDRRQAKHLENEAARYQTLLDRIQAKGNRFDDALNIVTSNNYCVQCHIVSDFVPKKDVRGMAPDLSRVYQRFRPEYLREWIANPKLKLPYTTMPDNLKYDAAAEFEGGVPQEFFHGTSTDQLDGLVDLLMNFDQYSKGQTTIADRVKPATETPPAAEGAK